MPRFFIRIVTLVLVPCLLGDPLLAAGYSVGTGITHPPALSSNLFREQAFNPPGGLYTWSHINRHASIIALGLAVIVVWSLGHSNSASSVLHVKDVTSLSATVIFPWEKVKHWWDNRKRKILELLKIPPTATPIGAQPTVPHRRDANGEATLWSRLPKRIALIGMPGAGKETNGLRLAKDLHIPIVSTGELLRNAKAHPQDYAAILSPEDFAKVSSGKDYPSADGIWSLLTKELSKPEYQSGYILDGWPRILENLRPDRNIPCDLIIHLEISPNAYRERAARRLQQAHAANVPPRADDDPGVVENRIHTYFKLTHPLVEHLQNDPRLVSINSEDQLDVSEEKSKAYVYSERLVPALCRWLNVHGQDNTSETVAVFGRALHERMSPAARHVREDQAWQSTRIVIFAGGSSTRLFPLVKQVVDPFGSGRTFLQQNIDYVAAWPDHIYPLTITEQSAEIRRQSANVIPQGHVVVAPHARGSMGSFLWAMAHIRRDMERQGLSDVVISTLNADTLTKHPDELLRSLRHAAYTAHTHHAIVMFGQSPTANPLDWKTMGSMRMGARVDTPDDNSDRPMYRGQSFVEKPGPTQAAEMIADGNWAWSTGFYVARLSVLEETMENFQPESWPLYQEILLALAAGDAPRAARSLEKVRAVIPYPGARPDESRTADNTLAYGLLMPLMLSAPDNTNAPYLLIVPTRFSWKDYGTWASLFNEAPRDAHGNHILGDPAHVSATQSSDNVFATYGEHYIAAIGVTGLLIVHTQEGQAMVTTLTQSGNVSQLARAAARTGEAVIQLESSHVRIKTDGPRVSVLGVKDLEIILSGNTLTVKALSPGPAAALKIPSILSAFLGLAALGYAYAMHLAGGGPAVRELSVFSPLYLLNSSVFALIYKYVWAPGLRGKPRTELKSIALFAKAA